MRKPDPEKHRVLCEKEELIAFMVEHAPYTPVRRITGGRDKGKYRAVFYMDAFPGIVPGSKEACKVFRDRVEGICAAWKYGHVQVQPVENTVMERSWRTGIVTQRKAICALFDFNAKAAKRYMAEFAACFPDAKGVSA